MSGFSNPGRIDLRDTSDLIPTSKPASLRLSVPWTADEQKAIRWLATTDTSNLSRLQTRVKGMAAALVIKELSASQLADLVKRWRRSLG